MSYCRWSCLDFQCDIYCWADVCGQWAVAVAKNKRVFRTPLPPPLPEGEDHNGQAYWDRHRAVMRAVDNSLMVPIELPGAGERYWLDSPGEAAAKIEELVRIGFRAPQYAIDALWEEQASIDGRMVKLGIDAGMTGE